MRRIKPHLITNKEVLKVKVRAVRTIKTVLAVLLICMLFGGCTKGIDTGSANSTDTHKWQQITAGQTDPAVTEVTASGTAASEVPSGIVTETGPGPSDTAAPDAVTGTPAPAVSPEKTDTATSGIASPSASASASATPTPTPSSTAKPSETAPVQSATAMATPGAAAQPYCRTVLSSGQREVYDKLKNALEGRQYSGDTLSVGVNYRFSGNAQDEIKLIINALISDNPQLYYFLGSWSYSYNSTTVVSIDLTVMTVQSIAAEKDKLAAEIKYYTDRLDASWSDYRISKRCYELLASRVEYKETGKRAHSMLGAFADRRCVCEGFAQAYQYLLNLYGIQAFTVTGDATNSAGNTEGHRWVAVKLDGSWYFTDPTWANTKSNGSVIPEKRVRVDYQYLNLTAADMGLDHELDNTSLKFTRSLAFNTEKDNYFVRQGLSINGFSEDKLRGILQSEIKAAVSEGRETVCLRMDSSDSFTAVKDYISHNIYSVYGGIKAETGKEMQFSLSLGSRRNVIILFLNY